MTHIARLWLQAVAIIFGATFVFVLEHSTITHVATHFGSILFHALQ